MKRFVILTLQTLMVVLSYAQNDYEFILPQQPHLSMQYPKEVEDEYRVFTWYALSFDSNTEIAFIYNDELCGYYDVPSELLPGFKSTCPNLQKEDNVLYWKRVKEIMKIIDDNIKAKKGQDKFVIEDDDTLYTRLKLMPTFPGGDEKMMSFLSQKLKYPELAEENGIQGNVVVSFVVNIDGSLSKRRIMKATDNSLINEALRLVSIMPKWIPGQKDGKFVKAKVTLPITFRLR